MNICARDRTIIIRRRARDNDSFLCAIPSRLSADNCIMQTVSVGLFTYFVAAPCILACVVGGHECPWPWAYRPSCDHDDDDYDGNEVAAYTTTASTWKMRAVPPRRSSMTFANLFFRSRPLPPPLPRPRLPITHTTHTLCTDATLFFITCSAPRVCNLFLFQSAALRAFCCFCRKAPKYRFFFTLKAFL